jgi:hypothetical protein
MLVLDVVIVLAHLPVLIPVPVHLVHLPVLILILLLILLTLLARSIRKQIGNSADGALAAEDEEDLRFSFRLRSFRPNPTGIESKSTRVSRDQTRGDQIPSLF